MDKIILRNATKQIKDSVVLNRINLELDRGGVYGFVGVNGSGKTMLFRAICGLIRLTEGEVEVFSKKVREEIAFPEKLGVIIESVGLWDEYTGYENLRLLARIKNEITEEDIRLAMRRVGLEPDDRRIYKKYSLGMKQRLAVAQAIMERPELLVLDEPTNALDENGVSLVHSIILEEQKRGATVLIASHNKEEIATLCSRIFRLSDGRLEELDGAAGAGNQEGRPS